MLESDLHTDDSIIRRLRVICWIIKDTDTHSEYVILIAYEQQRWLHERLSMLRLYVHCLSCVILYKVGGVTSRPRNLRAIFLREYPQCSESDYFTLC
jgi:hypothetical protein